MVMDSRTGNLDKQVKAETVESLLDGPTDQATPAPGLPCSPYKSNLAYLKLICVSH